jgi:hypothetical protein
MISVRIPSSFIFPTPNTQSFTQVRDIEDLEDNIEGTIHDFEDENGAVLVHMYSCTPGPTGPASDRVYALAMFRQLSLHTCV